MQYQEFLGNIQSGAVQSQDVVLAGRCFECMANFRLEDEVEFRSRVGIDMKIIVVYHHDCFMVHNRTH